MSLKVKCCTYIAPFPYEYAQRRITMIGLPPADRKHIQAHLVVHVCWYSFTDLGRIESRQNFRRKGKEGHTDIQPSTRVEPGLGRQRSYHCANLSLRQRTLQMIRYRAERPWIRTLRGEAPYPSLKMPLTGSCAQAIPRPATSGFE